MRCNKPAPAPRQPVDSTRRVGWHPALVEPLRGRWVREALRRAKSPPWYLLASVAAIVPWSADPAGCDCATHEISLADRVVSCAAPSIG